MEEKIKKLELEIKEKIEECNNYFQLGEEIKKECVPMIIQYTKESIVKEIEAFVKKDVKNTNNLGLEKLSNMKIEMNELVNKIDDLKGKLSQDNAIWKISKEFINNINFKEGDNFGKSYNNKKDILLNVGKFIKNELVKVADILIKYNYFQNEIIFPWKQSGNTYIYDNGVFMGDTARVKMEEYVELFEKYFTCNEKLIKLKEELEQTKALYLWEQA